MIDRALAAIRSTVTVLVDPARLARFTSAGIVGTAVDMVVLVLLVELAGLSPLLAKVASWEAAVVVIFLINDRWTFRRWGEQGIWPAISRLLYSNAIRIGGFAVTMAVLYALTDWYDVWYAFANLVGIGVGALVNYTFESLVTWRVHVER